MIRNENCDCELIGLGTNKENTKIVIYLEKPKNYIFLSKEAAEQIADALIKLTKILGI